jgi:hypothetical protein
MRSIMSTKKRSSVGLIAILLGTTTFAGCASSLLENSADRTEKSIAMSCRAWEERARKAAYPDPETIARHDQLLAKAATFLTEAQAQYHNVAARDTAIGSAAQSKIEADAIYDWRYDLKVAVDCWDGLKDIQPPNQQRAQLAEGQNKD